MFCADSAKKGLSVAVALGLGVFAQASDVTLTGTATGLFDNGLTTINGLTYVGSTFDITSSGGFYALGSNAGSPNFNNLGSFTLSGDPFDYTGDTFTLDITFTEPAGIQGSNTATYTAALVGDVTSNNVGGVSIDFPSVPTTFNFVDGNNSGFFTIVVNTLSVTPGLTAPATGEGQASQAATTPGPSAAGCIATGLVGAVLRRRRKK